MQQPTNKNDSARLALLCWQHNRQIRHRGLTTYALAFYARTYGHSDREGMKTTLVGACVCKAA